MSQPAAANDASVVAQRSAFYDAMHPHNLTPLWEVLHALLTPTPRSPALPARWDYATARAFLLEAGELISAEEAERRVLILENPGQPGSSAITRSLYAGLQLILPGEVAPCHRHTQCALRFVLEGEGAFTAVNGEKAIMQPFDLVLTPNWEWHDHGNQTDVPMIWLDGLDIPIVQHFDTSFAERLDQPAYPETRPPGDVQSRYGRNMRPVSGANAVHSGNQPLFHYPYHDWRSMLGDLRAGGEPDPHIGYMSEFINPANGGSIMPTIAAFVQLIPAGMTTRARRSTDGSVLVGVEGQGTVTVGDKEFVIGPRDVVVVPSWQSLTLSAEQQDWVLFSYSDRAAQEKLGLFREWRGDDG